MAIIGIKSLRYGVDSVETSARFFADLGLPVMSSSDDRALFRLDDGSTVELLPREHGSLPWGELEGTGVREIVWGVDSATELKVLVERLRQVYPVNADEDGAYHFVPEFGVPMALAHWEKRRVVCAPDPLNAPDRVNRLNTHRKWRKRARPKSINHVVFRSPDYGQATLFMCQQLGFRVSDVQDGFAIYLRGDGCNNHHNFLLLNASAPLPGCDGKTAFDHANFGVEDIDELMVGVNYMVRHGWAASEVGLGRHRIDSALFYYFPCPAGGEAELGADADYVDDGWVPRRFTVPLFAYAHFTHNLPAWLQEPPAWEFSYLREDELKPQNLVSII